MTRNTDKLPATNLSTLYVIDLYDLDSKGVLVRHLGKWLPLVTSWLIKLLEESKDLFNRNNLDLSCSGVTGGLGHRGSDLPSPNFFYTSPISQNGFCLSPKIFFTLLPSPKMF